MKSFLLLCSDVICVSHVKPLKYMDVGGCEVTKKFKHCFVKQAKI